MARDKDFDLRAALAKPSFTPGQRDIGALVELIATDEDAMVHASPALAKLGEAALAAVLAGIANATPNDDGGAARLASVLGLMARAGDRAARSELLARLGDGRVRVRRAAIVALGKLGATRDHRASEPDDDVRLALITRWDATDVPPDERRALAEALGKIGGAGVRERLESLDAASDKELERRRDRALLVADREGKRGEDSEVLVDKAPPRALVVRLGCRPALAELLIAEARAAGFDGKAVRDDAVEVPLTGAWQTLFASRLWATASIRVEDRGLRAHARGDRSKDAHRATSENAHRTTPDRASDRTRAAKDDRANVTDAIVRAVLSDNVRGLMTAWTRGPIRWRLSLARGHQRAVVWNVAKDVTKSAPMLINDPTQTTWDVRVDDEEGVLELVPRRAPDPRFAYRVADVPAASHPSVAAAVAWLAGIAKGDRVWDPFCGSGLELVECALRGAGTLVGSDLDDEALAAARANLDAAGIAMEARTANDAAARAILVRGDARQFAPDGLVDAIVTNPPLGSRVHVDAGALLAETLPHFARQLKPNGRLVWITPQWRRTTPAAEAHGLVLVRSLFVDLGGVRGRLERWDRRR